MQRARLVTFALGLLINSAATAQSTNCDYEHDIRTYFCRNIRDVFPNVFYGNYHLQCVNCSIGTFSNRTFPFANNLVSFNASESGVKLITPRAFSSLSNLQYIYLQSNEIEEIAPGAFAGLRQVYDLHLENNRLENMIPGFLADFNANSVSLGGNRLKSVPDGAFEGSLGILIVDLGSNRIKTVEVDAFLGLDSVEVLNLEKNEICYLPLGVFGHVPTLRQLNLADNKMSKLTFGTFSGLSHLSYLNLANNSVSVFDGNVLIPLSRLEKLDLGGNRIYYLDANSIHANVPRLRTIRIDDNLLSCVHVINIIQYFRKVNIEVVNTVERYHIQNVNGIACTEIILNHSVDFQQFLKAAEEDTKKSVLYC